MFPAGGRFAGTALVAVIANPSTKLMKPLQFGPISRRPAPPWPAARVHRKHASRSAKPEHLMQHASSKPRRVVGCTDQRDGARSEKSGQVGVIVGGGGDRSGVHE